MAILGLLTAAGAFSLGRWSAPPGKSPAARETGSMPGGTNPPDTIASSGGPEMADSSAAMGMAKDGAIRLTAGEIGTFGITFGTAEIRPLVRTLRAVGIVDFDETRMVYVSPKFGGWAERLYVDFTGEFVREGDPLLDVYSPDLITAQEDLLLAARMTRSVQESEVPNVSTDAEELLEAARRRLGFWDISRSQIARLLETRKVRRTLTLLAPATGVVMRKDIFEGQAFQPGTNLYMIADLSTVWVEARVFEEDAALMREGMPARISITGFPDRTFAGRIEYVYPTVEDRTRSLRARVSIPNPRGELKPGMYATVRLDAPIGQVLTVPASAVFHTGERTLVFVDTGGGKFAPREVVPGARGGDYVQVHSGLQAGQRIVTSPQFLLDSESNLMEVMKAMMAQMSLSDVNDMGMSGADMPGMKMDRKPAASPADTTGGR